MSRYYFDMRENGDLYQDEEGIDLSDAGMIKKEAAVALLEIARDHATNRVQSTLSVEVRDEMGVPVLKVVVTIDAQKLDDLCEEGWQH